MRVYSKRELYFLSFLIPGFTAWKTGNLKVLRMDMKWKGGKDNKIIWGPDESGVVT